MDENKAKMLQDVKRYIQTSKKVEYMVFDEMCEKLGVSEDDKDIFLDYCFNDLKSDYGMGIIKSYLEAEE